MDIRVKELMVRKKWEQSAEILLADIEKSPLDADIRFHLAFALHEGKQHIEALNHYLAVLGLDPKHVAARNNLGNLLASLGKIEPAMECFRKVLQSDPEHTNAMFMLGTYLSNKGDLKEAAELLRKAAKHNPNLQNVHSVLGGTLVNLGHIEEGANVYRQCIDRQANEVNHNNLGSIYNKQGRAKEASEQFRAALNYANGPTAARTHSNIILTAHYLDDHDEEALAAELSTWADRHEAPLRTEQRPLTNSSEPNRPLRVGYLSADFCRHPVGFFWLNVLTSHDQQKFTTFCYSSTLKPDHETEKMKSAAMNWREVVTMSDSELAELIRRDCIDVLVDLSGHTARHRLLVLARRAAPVQIVAGGHFCSTGMSEVDYLIADKIHAPEGSAREFSERLIRLPDGYTCYAPPSYAPPVSVLPAGDKNSITFGCFNNLAKFSPRIIALWAEVLKAVPNARFLLHSKTLSDASTAARCRKLFEDHGIDGARIITGPGAPHDEFIGFYNDVDIALDTYPYSGGLTTPEALWMGVPVVTLPGWAFCGKHSASHLSVVGLSELIAKSPEEFVEIACRLANDRNHLANLRSSMRDRLRKSPLLDSNIYTRHLEEAYHKAWLVWCEGEARP